MDKESSANSGAGLSHDQTDWLESLEVALDSLRDPVMERVINDARAASEMASIVPLTVEDQKRLIGDLDFRWKQWLNEPVLLRGKVFYDIAESDRDGQRREAILWDTRAISSGFNVLKLAIAPRKQ
jgi:hypothetical protein